MDSRDPIVVQNGTEGSIYIDLSEKHSEHDPDAKEDIDKKLPKPLTAYVNSDHAHNKATHHSMTGHIIFIGRT